MAHPPFLDLESAPMPNILDVILIVYVVLVLFGFYLIYMYDPHSVHWLFSRLFNPLIP